MTARCDARWRVAPLDQLFTDAILLQAPVECAAAHAELLRREPDVAAVPRQDLLDEDALGLLERQLVGAGRRRAARGCRPRCRARDRASPPDPPSAPRARRCAPARGRCRASGAPAAPPAPRRRSRRAACDSAPRSARENARRAAAMSVAPIAQRRQVDHDGVETVEQILAEPAGRDLRRQVGVGRRQHADVDVAQPRRADALRPRRSAARAAAWPAAASACSRSRRGTACPRRPSRSSRSDRPARR